MSFQMCSKHLCIVCIKLIMHARVVKLQTCLCRPFSITFARDSTILFPKMSSRSNCLSVSPGTVLSVVCLLLYSAGFVRIELKFNDHDQRLTAVEEVIISQMKQGMADTSWSTGKVLLFRGNFLNLKPFPLLQFTYKSHLYIF